MHGLVPRYDPYRQQMFELSSFNVIQILGADAEKVINNLCTNDVKKLETGRSCEVFITNIRGWCVEHGFALKLNNAIQLIGEFGNSAALCAHIDRYIIREDARITNLSDSKSVYLLNEQEAGRLADFAGAATLLPKNHAILETEFASLRAMAASVRLLHESDVLMLTQKNDAQAFVNAVLASGLSLESSDDFERARIASFWPRTGREILDKSIPQELDRDPSAISFTKGCYLGQETIARLDAIGQLQKKLCLLRINTDGPIEAGTAITKADQNVGQITSAMHDSKGGYVIALAYLRRGNFEPGLQLKCNNADAVVMPNHS